MGTGYKIERTKRSIQNLRSIFDYVNKKESFERANYVIDGIDDAINRILPVPTKHRIEPIFNRSDIRYILKWHYKIVFQIANDKIRILSVFHTAQNPGKLKKYKP
jgi:toxin ParE1/3/4